MLSLAASPLALVIPGVGHDLSRVACPSRTPSVRMESLASKMFGDVARGFGGLGKALGIQAGEEAPVVNKEAGANDVVADLDKRAQTGDITFNDFIVSSPP